MSIGLHTRRPARKVISAAIVFFFTLNMLAQPATLYAQTLAVGPLTLPAPGMMVPVSPGFAPMVIKAVTIDPKNPLQFDFIMDTGDSGLSGEKLKEESARLIKYFLAAITVPEEDLWVNLSPREKDRIVPETFGQTEMGRDLLAQDYILKQMTASLMYPEDELGKKFWKELRAKAKREYGLSDLPRETFNKVWILPKRAVVYEHEGSAFVIDQELKVMMERDYLARSQSPATKLNGQAQVTRSQSIEGAREADLSVQVMRELIVPEIEKEVNYGKNFAPLRQIYHSMILASWYKDALKESLLNRVYADQNKIKGIDVDDKQAKQKIYEQYLRAFRKGVYNYIKKDINEETGQVEHRKYFSGGVSAINVGKVREDVRGEPDQLPAKDRAMLTRGSSERSRFERMTARFVENVDDSSARAAEEFAAEPADRAQLAQVSPPEFESRPLNWLPPRRKPTLRVLPVPHTPEPATQPVEKKESLPDPASQDVVEDLIFALDFNGFPLEVKQQVRGLIEAAKIAQAKKNLPQFYLALVKMKTRSMRMGFRQSIPDIVSFKIKRIENFAQARNIVLPRVSPGSDLSRITVALRDRVNNLVEGSPVLGVSRQEQAAFFYNGWEGLERRHSERLRTGKIEADSYTGLFLKWQRMKDEADGDQVVLLMDGNAQQGLKSRMVIFTAEGLNGLILEMVSEHREADAEILLAFLEEKAGKMSYRQEGITDRAMLSAEIVNRAAKETLEEEVLNRLVRMKGILRKIKEAWQRSGEEMNDEIKTLLEDYEEQRRPLNLFAWLPPDEVMALLQERLPAEVDSSEDPAMQKAKYWAIRTMQVNLNRQKILYAFRFQLTEFTEALIDEAQRMMNSVNYMMSTNTVPEPAGNGDKYFIIPHDIFWRDAKPRRPDRAMLGVSTLRYAAMGEVKFTLVPVLERMKRTIDNLGQAADDDQRKRLLNDLESGQDTLKSYLQAQQESFEQRKERARENVFKQATFLVQNTASQHLRNSRLVWDLVDTDSESLRDLRPDAVRLLKLFNYLTSLDEVPAVISEGYFDVPEFVYQDLSPNKISAQDVHTAARQELTPKVLPALEEIIAALSRIQEIRKEENALERQEKLTEKKREHNQKRRIEQVRHYQRAVLRLIDYKASPSPVPEQGTSRDIAVWLVQRTIKESIEETAALGTEYYRRAVISTDVQKRKAQRLRAFIQYLMDAEDVVQTPEDRNVLKMPEHIEQFNNTGSADRAILAQSRERETAGLRLVDSPRKFPGGALQQNLFGPYEPGMEKVYEALVRNDFRPVLLEPDPSPFAEQAQNIAKSGGWFAPEGEELDADRAMLANTGLAVELAWRELSEEMERFFNADRMSRKQRRDALQKIAAREERFHQAEDARREQEESSPTLADRDISRMLSAASEISGRERSRILARIKTFKRKQAVGRRETLADLTGLLSRIGKQKVNLFFADGQVPRITLTEAAEIVKNSGPSYQGSLHYFEYEDGSANVFLDLGRQDDRAMLVEPDIIEDISRTLILDEGLDPVGASAAFRDDGYETEEGRIFAEVVEGYGINIDDENVLLYLHMGLEDISEERPAGDGWEQYVMEEDSTPPLREALGEMDLDIEEDLTGGFDNAMLAARENLDKVIAAFNGLVYSPYANEYVFKTWVKSLSGDRQGPFEVRVEIGFEEETRFNPVATLEVSEKGYSLPSFKLLENLRRKMEKNVIYADGAEPQEGQFRTPPFKGVEGLILETLEKSGLPVIKDVLKDSGPEGLVLSPEHARNVDRAALSKTVLVVDDHSFLRETIAENLKSQGYSVVEAQDGQEALNLLAANGKTVDLVLTDVQMPRMGGIALTEQVNVRYPALPVIVMSNRDAEFAAALSRLRIVRFIDKKVLVNELIPAVEQIIPLVPGDQAVLAATPTVLVVEKNGKLREAIAQNVRAKGYGTMTAPNSDQALAVLSANPRIGLILTGLGVPDMSGVSFVKEINARYPNLPVVLMSFNMPNHRGSLQNSGLRIAALWDKSELHKELDGLAELLPLSGDEAMMAGQKTVLVMDRDRDRQKFIVESLEAQGYRVLLDSAGDVYGGWRALHDLAVDLVVLGVDRSGYASQIKFKDDLQDKYPEVPVIAWRSDPQVLAFKDSVGFSAVLDGPPENAQKLVEAVRDRIAKTTGLRGVVKKARRTIESLDGGPVYNYSILEVEKTALKEWPLAGTVLLRARTSEKGIPVAEFYLSRKGISDIDFSSLRAKPLKEVVALRGTLGTIAEALEKAFPQTAVDKAMLASLMKDFRGSLYGSLSPQDAYDTFERAMEEKERNLRAGQGLGRDLTEDDWTVIKNGFEALNKLALHLRQSSAGAGRKTKGLSAEEEKAGPLAQQINRVFRKNPMSGRMTRILAVMRELFGRAENKAELKAVDEFWLVTLSFLEKARVRVVERINGMEGEDISLLSEIDQGIQELQAKLLFYRDLKLKVLQDGPTDKGAFENALMLSGQKTVLVLGAGQTAEGFIARTLSEQGYKVVFVSGSIAEMRKVLEEQEVEAAVLGVGKEATAINSLKESLQRNYPEVALVVLDSSNQTVTIAGHDVSWRQDREEDRPERLARAMRVQIGQTAAARQVVRKLRQVVRRLGEKDAFFEWSASVRKSKQWYADFDATILLKEKMEGAARPGRTFPVAVISLNGKGVNFINFGFLEKARRDDPLSFPDTRRKIEEALAKAFPETAGDKAMLVASFDDLPEGVYPYEVIKQLARDKVFEGKQRELERLLMSDAGKDSWIIFDQDNKVHTYLLVEEEGGRLVVKRYGSRTPEDERQYMDNFWLLLAHVGIVSKEKIDGLSIIRAVKSLQDLETPYKKMKGYMHAIIEEQDNRLTPARVMDFAEVGYEQAHIILQILALEQVTVETSALGEYRKNDEVSGVDRAVLSDQKTVLVVDDDFIDQHQAKTVLEEQGYKVLTVATIHRALDELEANPVDLVVTDIMLNPHGTQTGFMLKDRVREIFPDLPFIAMSQIPERLDSSGFVAKLEKGTDSFPQELVKAVQQAIGPAGEAGDKAMLVASFKNLPAGVSLDAVIIQAAQDKSFGISKGQLQSRLLEDHKGLSRVMLDQNKKVHAFILAEEEGDLLVVRRYGSRLTERKEEERRQYQEDFIQMLFSLKEEQGKDIDIPQSMTLLSSWQELKDGYRETRKYVYERMKNTVDAMGQGTVKALTGLKGSQAYTVLRLLDLGGVIVPGSQKGLFYRKQVGGIDLTRKALNLQIKRDGNGVPLPVDQQPIENMHIEGFFPVIINVTPVPSLPMLIGLKDIPEEKPVPQKQAKGGDSPFDRKREFILREEEPEIAG